MGHAILLRTKEERHLQTDEFKSLQPTGGMLLGLINKHQLKAKPVFSLGLSVSRETIKFEIVL